jgi:hypothetical protein
VNINFQPVMKAQFAALQAAASIPFTATATSGSAVLAGVSTFVGLFVGLPVFGSGAARFTTIQALDEATGTVTLTDALTASGSDVRFTTGFLTTDARLKHWSEVSAQPALFFRRIGVTDQHFGDLLMMTTLECEAWIYANTGKNPDAVPGDMLASLEQLVRQSFKPDGPIGEPRFTLGGLAYWSRIEGRTESSDGAQTGQAISRIPVRITLP